MFGLVHSEAMALKKSQLAFVHIAGKKSLVLGLADFA